jgi:hypothetical protein
MRREVNVHVMVLPSPVQFLPNDVLIRQHLGVYIRGGFLLKLQTRRNFQVRVFIPLLFPSCES